MFELLQKARALKNVSLGSAAQCFYTAIKRFFKNSQDKYNTQKDLKTAENRVQNAKHS